MLPSKFGVNWPFGSGEEAKNRFSRWLPSWISNRHDFSYFWFISHPKLPNQFGVNWLFGLGVEAKNRFSRWLPWWPSGFPTDTILAIFDLQVTLMLPSKFGVNWPFGSGEEAKIDFRWRPPWISDRKDFSSFWSTSHPDASYQVSSQLAQGHSKRRLLKQLFTPHDVWCTTHDGRWTLTDHNSSPWALHAQVS